jgi:hypothetical protein
LSAVKYSKPYNLVTGLKYCQARRVPLGSHAVTSERTGEQGQGHYQGQEALSYLLSALGEEPSRSWL